MKESFSIFCCCIVAGCAYNTPYVPKSTYLSPFDRPIDNTEMLCERVDVNNPISDNIVCTEARIGNSKGGFYTTYNQIVMIPSESLYIKNIYDTKLNNPNEIRDAAFKICTIRVFNTMNESLHKKLYCDCSADFVYKSLQNKKNVTGKDVIDLFANKTSYEIDPLGINVVHANCRNVLDRYMTYDNTYREFYDDCIRTGKDSKESCDETTKLILAAFGITKTKGVYHSDIPSDEEFDLRVQHILMNQ